MPRFITNTKWYGWNAPEALLRATKRRLLLIVGINLALSLACGLIPTGVTRHNWVAFAATAALVALSGQLIGLIRFYRAKDHLYQREFEGIDHFIRLSCLFHVILTVVAAAAAVVSCVTNWTGIMDLLVTLLLVVTGACSWLVYRLYRALPTYEMQPPE